MIHVASKLCRERERERERKRERKNFFPITGFPPKNRAFHEITWANIEDVKPQITM
jgi:hypothetical protein